MIPEDNGTNTTQQIYQLATQPIFATDHNVDPENVTWEVSDGSLDYLANPIEENPGQEESPIHPENEEGSEKPGESDSESNETSSEDEEEKTKKKNRVSERKRIAQLTRQLKQAQSVTHDVLARNQYLETKLTEKQKEALASEENFLSSQKERVKQILTDAIEEGDASKIAEAQDLLSQYNTQIQLKKTQASTFQNTPQNTYTPPSPIIDEDDDDNEEGRSWLENNSWADPKADDFDEDLYNVADQYSIKLAKKYTLQGKKSEIGSPKFWNEITNYMHESYEISDESPQHKPPSPSSKTQSKGRTPMKTTPYNTVAPVSRQSVPGEAPRKQNDIVLTPEQREAAYAMRGYIRDPKTGQPLTDRKALEEAYKRNMR